MITTLRVRMRDRERQKFFGVYLGAKMISVGVILFGMVAIAWYFSTKAGAAMIGQETPPLKADDIINPLNTVWVLVAAFLVFFMQAGFMALEAGFARTREVSNIMLECIVDTCLCGILFWAWGFAFMFGSGNGWIGHEYFFLNNAPATYGSTGVAFLAFFLFQFAFADTCSTITSGAMVGRTAFGGDLLYSLGVSGFIYPIVGHWIWGPDGWLATTEHTVPRLRRVDGRAHGRRHARARRCDRARTAARSQVQARRRWHATRSRHGDRRRSAV